MLKRTNFPETDIRIGNGFKISVDGVLYKGEMVIKVPFPEAQLSKLKFKKLSDREYYAKDIIATKSGLEFIDDDFMVKLDIERWENVTSAYPAEWRVNGVLAFATYLAFDKWSFSENARIALAKLKNGETTFEEIRDVQPDIIFHPLIKDEWAKLFNKEMMPRNKTGRPKSSNPTLKILELYHWVSSYRAGGFSIAKACEKALKLHPHLVPDNWKGTDGHNETLEKKVKRLDKDPALSSGLGTKKK